MRLSALTTCTLLATTALANPAYGQAYSAQARQFPDENGVDVITGKANIAGGAVSIGRPGDSGMAYTYGWSGGIFTDTFDLTMYNQPFDGSQPVAFTIFGQQKRFNYVSGAWQSFDGDGSTFVEDTSINGFRYTTRDGTIFTFLKSLADTGWQAQVAARVSTIAFPSGELWTYTYSLHAGENIPSFPEPIIYPAMGRVQSVNSNLGYQLKPSYATNTFNTNGSSNANWPKLTKVTAINNAVDYCSPSADTCSGFTKTWPALTISQSTASGVLTYNFTDPQTRSTLIGTTANVGSPLSVQSPGNSSADTGITYDGALRVETVAKGGGTWGYSYVDSGGGTVRTTTVSQPLGGSKIYVVDLTKNLLTSVTDELSRTTSFIYDSFGRQTRATMPEGNYVETEYDSRGNVTKQFSRSKTTNPVPDVVVSATYDACISTNTKTCNQPVTVTDARGFVTDYSYDTSHGGMLSETRPSPDGTAARPQTRFGYTSQSAYYKNSSGTIVAAPTPVYKLTSVSACQTGSSCIGTATETKSVIARGTTGVANNLLPTSLASGAGDGSLTATTGFTNDHVGNVTHVDGPLADDTTVYEYNLTRQVTKVTTPDPDGSGGPLAPRVYNVTYGANGLADAMYMTSTGPRQEFAYDSLGRLITQSWKSGGVNNRVTHAVTQHSYDTKGRLSCSAVRMNTATFASLPASACTAATAGSQGPDRIGQLTYNNADELTKKQVAVGTTAASDELTLTYTSNGLLQTLKDGENNLTTYTYDSQDRLWRTEYPSSTQGSGSSNANDREELTYENTAGGTRTSAAVASVRMRDGSVIGLSYDNLNRLKAKNLPGAEWDEELAYDNLDRLTSAGKCSGPGTCPVQDTFSYDALSRQTSNSQLYGTISRDFDLAGRMIRTAWPDGFYVNYDRLVTGELSKVRENGASSGAGVLATFGYDSLGRRTSKTFGYGAATYYGYDGISRLNSLTIDYTGSANDLTETFTHNPASQIVSVERSNDAYAWTGHGNGSTATVVNGLNQLSTVGGASVTYDGKGNLTADPVTSQTFSYGPQNEFRGNVNLWLAYDALGRAADHSVNWLVTSQFMFDGVQVASVYAPGSGLTERYVWGDGPDELIAWYDGSGTSGRRYAQTDERGSLLAYSDTSGNVLGINKYDEFGRPQGSNTGRFQYTGQMWLPQIAFHFYKARAYDPRSGKFPQTDPIGYEAGPNLYAYVGDDPVNWRDPLGLQACGGAHGPCPQPQPGDVVVIGNIPFNLTGGGGLVVANLSRQFRSEDHPSIHVFGSRTNRGNRRLVRKDIVTLAWCSLSGLLGSRGRFRIGGDAAAGFGAFLRGGVGLSVRGDGSLEFDLYAGAGVGIGFLAGYGMGVDNSGGSTRGVSLSPSREATAGAGVGFLGGGGTLPNRGTIGAPSLDWNDPQGSLGGSAGPRIGLAVGSTKTANLSVRLAPACF